MPNWNSSAPEVLGNEWLINWGGTSRVWAGAPAAMARMQSTVTETITALKMSATVNPLLRESIPTVVDVIEEGNEETALYSTAMLAPNQDIISGGWRTRAGGTTNLYTIIDSPTTKWPNTAISSNWILNGIANEDPYECHFDTTQFEPAGALVDSRVGFVAVQIIAGAITGFRKLRVGIDIGGVGYPPAGGSTRDVSQFGSIQVFWYGEINPSTGRPWTPADIADFKIGGGSKLRIQTVGTTGTQYPVVWAVSLNVAHLPVDNRVAVGVWRRPEVLTSRLTNVTTDTLRTVPAGTANWAKTSGKNYLFYWRQSVSPSEYGAVVADDVRWNAVRQNLGPNGQPPGWGAAPGGVLGAMGTPHDMFGRPADGFTPFVDKTVMPLVMVRSDASMSTDSQPYRLDAADLALVKTTQKLGQRVTPASTQTYLGVRFLVAPPQSGNPTLSVTVNRASDGVQMGGTFTITADTARGLTTALATGVGNVGIGSWKYVTGFLSSGAALVSGTAYEIRVTTTAGGDWTMAMPDSSLGESASFGGSTNGAFIGATHVTTRDLSINITRQPDPPTNVTATIVNLPITTYAAEATTIQHVNVTWTLPAVGMGASFARYEIERQHDGGVWNLIAKIGTAATTTFQDHEAPRNTVVRYRARAIGVDGRFSISNQSGTVTPATTGSLIILTSNHSTSLEAVYIHDRESTYPLLAVERDETVAIHGADYQVVFSEAEDRGIGWRTQITITQISAVGKGGQHKLTPLLNLTRSTDIPYICVMDRQGTQIFGHVRASDAAQKQPANRYTAQLDIIPTHTQPVPVTI